MNKAVKPARTDNLKWSYAKPLIATVLYLFQFQSKDGYLVS